MQGPQARAGKPAPDVAAALVPRRVAAHKEPRALHLLRLRPRCRRAARQGGHHRSGGLLQGQALEEQARREDEHVADARPRPVPRRHLDLACGGRARGGNKGK